MRGSVHQQVADTEHMTVLNSPTGNAAIDIQTAHFGVWRTEYPMRHAGRNPYSTLRRRNEASGTGLDLKHPLNGVRQLHPRMAVAAGQCAIG